MPSTPDHVRGGFFEGFGAARRVLGFPRMSVARVEERYVIGERLGSGAMGEVYAARDRELGIDVALKCLVPELVGSTEGVRRFGYEAALGRRMKSPHIVSVLGLAVTYENVPCIVYERLFGETLADRIDRREQLSVAEIVSIVKQTAAALTHAHQLGVVHRDVKPANIFLTRTPDGRVHVKLIDFGVAECARKDGVFEDVELAGTPEYLSPEQLRGERRPDPSDDVYALAVVAFEALTGRVPFEGELGQLVGFATSGEVPSVRESRPELRSAVDAWFRRALDRCRERRFATAKDLARSLELLLSDAALVPLRVAA